MHKLALSDDEILVLENYFKYSPVALIRVKAQVIVMRHVGLDEDQISRVVMKNVRSVGRYIRDFSEMRLASLFSGHIDNENASKLTRNQKEEIRKTLLTTPEKGGLPIKFWDVPKLKNYIKAEFGVVYESDQSYHFLLKFGNLSFKYPDKTSPRRDEEFIVERIKEIKNEIQPLLADPNWVVLASDEVRVQLEAEIRKAWLVKGKKTKIKTERSRQHQNYIGFLDQKTNKCQIFEIKKGNGQETIRVLKKLVGQYPNQRVCVVWDNAKWHKGKLLRQELTKGKKLQNLHLINFPPYAPEHNPIEHVWKHAKRKISNSENILFEDIKIKFEDVIKEKTFNYKI